MEEVNETLEFLRFSYRADATYNGVVMFVLSCDDTEHLRSVEIRDGVVSIRNQPHPDPSCVVRCAKDTFLGVYSGDLHPRTAILGGRLHVDGFNYNELRKFLSSFDFSSAKWRQFYQAREAQPVSNTLDHLLSSWSSMLIPTAHAHSASKSLHLSRRVLTQNTISNVCDGVLAVSALPSSTPTIATVRAPQQPIAFRGHHFGSVVQVLNTFVRHPAMAVAREHADFMHRLL